MMQNPGKGHPFVAIAPASGGAGLLDRGLRWKRRVGLLRLSFLFCVVAPTLLGAAYVLLLAPREYVSEFRVVIRSAAPSALRLAGALSGALSPATALLAGASDTTQNAFMASDYIKSRNMVSGLGGKARVIKLYSAAQGGGFGGLKPDASFEDAWTFWQSKVRTQIDLGSGILTVQVRAFAPADALRLAGDMVGLSEAMVNNVSERSRSDALARAVAEVDRARGQVVSSDQALLKFRNAQGVIDPAKNAAAIGGLLTDLLKERMVLENQRAAMGGQVAENSPVVRLMRGRIADIDGQMNRLKRELTSQNTSPAISAQLATYETLQLRNKFAQEMYRLAQAAYETARETKERQQLYLMTIVRPSLPEEALYPRRAADIFLVFGLCLIVWSIGALVVAAVLDHVA